MNVNGDGHSKYKLPLLADLKIFYYLSKRYTLFTLIHATISLQKVFIIINFVSLFTRIVSHLTKLCDDDSK